MSWLEAKMNKSGGSSRQPGESQADFTQRKIDAYDERIDEREADDKSTTTLREQRDELRKEKRMFEAETPEEFEALKEEEGVVVLHSYSDETATREVDTYNGVTITYDPLKNDYYANVGGVGKRCDSIDEAHAFIDREQYLQSPEHRKEVEAQKLADQKAASDKAFYYGIGTDSKGNEIPPTQAEIEAREDYYAKERLIRGTTTREEYEVGEGITVSAEEQALRDAALVAEAEEQGKFSNIYWLRLQGEWRQLRTELVNIKRMVTG